jgi:TorA maturation chaperone TorD
MSQPKPVVLSEADAGEELARAEIYGVLAGLLYAPPSAELLEQFQVAVTQAPVPGSFLEGPWQDLVAAARASDVRRAAAEYDALFMGVGKPEVDLHGSYYLTGYLHETPLVKLRDALRALGLERDAQMVETEDHVAYGFEVMRYLIAGDEIEVCNLEQQRQFFRAHLQPWVDQLCDALMQHPEARLYAATAAFTRAFMQIEAQGFDMLE